MTFPIPCSRRRALGALAAACVGASVIRSARAQATGATIHFYSPETNINNFGTLKTEFDSFFKDLGGHKFQPYGDRAAFEKALEAGTGLFLLSSWHYPQLEAKAKWQPTLIGQLKGKFSQRHVLCAKKPVASIDALKGANVVSAGNAAFIQSLLTDLLGPNHRALLKELNVLRVPKDSDALTTVFLGGAQAAVATEGGLDRLAKSSASQHEALVQLAKGPERLLPIVIAPTQPDAGTQALLKVLTAMGADAEGQQRLRLVGLDALAPATDAHRAELRK